MKFDKVGFVAKQYQQGWSVWVKADAKSMLIGSGIKSEQDVHNLINSMEVVKERYMSRKEQQKLLKEVEELRAYKANIEKLKPLIQSMTELYNLSAGLRPNDLF